MLLLFVLAKDLPASFCRRPEVVERRTRMEHSEQPGIRQAMLQRAVGRLPQSRCAKVSRRYCKDCTPTLLWTFPGSGNTFVRALIEAATSIYTGSMFSDRLIAKNLPGENAKVKTYADCQRVAVIKAHPNHDDFESHQCGFPIFTICDCRVTKAVIVARHPVSAAWAEFHRRYFKKKKKNQHVAALTNKDDWLPSWISTAPTLLRSWRNAWNREYAAWMAAYGNGSYLIVRFEDLVDPAAQHFELKRTIDYIGLTATNDSLACAFSSDIAEAFHRPPHRRRLWNDSESASAHDAWLELPPTVRRDLSVALRPTAEALGYSVVR